MYLNEHLLRHVVPEALVIAPNFVADDQAFCVDSRILQSGEIFVALSGQHTDGHEHIVEALTAGASGVILAMQKRGCLDGIDQRLIANKLIIAVPSPLEALYALAAAWRSLYQGPIIAVTGSVGKTSTKEILAAIIRRNGKECLCSHANQNTKLGIALNMLRIRLTDCCAIFEVGINARGEMADSISLLRPTRAIITGVAHSHLEGLGSVSDVAVEKRMIFSCFASDDIGIINGDQPLLANVGYPHPIVKFGFKTINQVQARKVRIVGNKVHCTFKIYNEKFSLVLPHTHNGMIVNALAAAAAAYLLDIPASEIVNALQEPIPIPGRFERRILKNNKGFLIHDAYNANPESMKAALATFMRMQDSSNKIVVLGDMLELGVNTPFWHRQLGRVLRKISTTHHIILVGSHIQWTKRALPVGASVDTVATWQEAVDALEKKLISQSLVLVKASHGVGLHHLATMMSEQL